MFKKFLRDEQGIGMLIVIGFMALSVPLITSALVLAGTVSRDSQVKRQIAERQYSNLGGLEFIRYLSVDPETFANWLDDTGGTDSITVGGETIDISIAETIDPDNYSPDSTIEIKEDADIFGDLISGGADIVIKENANIYGDVRSGNNVELKEDSDVYGDIVSVGTVMLRQDASVIFGNILSGGDVTLKEDSDILGNITSGGNVVLQEDARVTGNVIAAGSVTLGEDAQVDGFILEGQIAPTIPTLVTILLLTPAVMPPGSMDVSIPNDGSLVLTPGSYGKFDGGEDGSVSLSAGHYSFTEFKTKEDFTINADVSGGTITIDVDTVLDLKEDATMNVIGGSSDKVMFRVQETIKVREHSDVHGTYLTLGAQTMQVLSVTDSSGNPIGSIQVPE